MPNQAKERLDAVMKMMIEWDWHTFHFPNHPLTYPRLSSACLLMREVEEKLPVPPEDKKHPNNCWKNSRLTKEAHPEMEYWEGFIARKNGDSAWPTPHGWNMKDGKIFDTSVNSEEWDYFGMHCPDKQFFRHD